MKSRVSFDPEFEAPAKGQEKIRSKRRLIREWLISIGIAGPIAGYLLSPIWGSPNFGKPLGRAIPNQLPDEANRVVNPQGFSLVIPPNWESRVFGSEPFAGIGAYPRDLIPRRWGAGLGVERLPNGRSPDLAGFQPAVFQGKPAHELISTRSEVLFDNPAMFSYVLLFQRNGAWYKLVYHVADDRKSLPPIMLRYFNTFQVNHGS